MLPGSEKEMRTVVLETNRLALYRSVDFVEYGRNPKGFRSRLAGWQELVLLLLEF